MRHTPGMAAAAALTVAPTPANADRVLRAEVVVKASVNEAWKAWTTEAGIATFFAPVGHVDLRVDGTYDVWFFPERGPGERGAEGMRILDVEPLKRFAFTWDAPPSNPKIRGKRTVVVVDFEPRGEGATRVRLTHLGWGEGLEWDQAYEYFDRAWAAHVLPRFVHRFERGPIDWDRIPELEPVTASMKQTLLASEAAPKP